MFDYSFKRLLWKELRTQWHIWAALLVGAFLLQLLYLLPFRGVAIAPDYPFYVGLVLTACYAVTCGAVLFAGEREEQTDDWLRQLPMTSRGLIAGKVTFLLLSLTAFAAAVYMVAFLLLQTTNLGATSSRFFWGDLRELSLVFLQAILGMTALSVFYSLILNRVMAVLAASVATYLVVAVVIDNLLPGPFETWMTGVTVVVAVADLWLGKQWLAGRSSRTMQGARARLEGDRTATGLRSRFWLSSIRQAAQMTPLGMRTASVLLWRELRSAVPFAVAWGLGGVLMFGLSSESGMDGANYFWLLLTPLLCGLMTCTGDNTRQTFRFLADRGLSPVTVWITKHAVWLLVAVGLAVLFGWYDMSTVSGGFDEYELRRRKPPRALYGFAALASVPGFLAEPQFEAESKWRTISGIMSLGLALYFLGHVCSLWFRRVIVAVSVAGLCGVLLVAWTAISLRLDVPPLLTLWPLVLAGVAASLLTVSGWLHERSSWKRLLAQAAWVVVPILVVGSSTMAYRARQIPVVTLPFNWQAKAAEMERTDAQWERDWQQTFDDLRSLSSGARPFSASHGEDRSEFEDPSGDGSADANTDVTTRAAEMAADRARKSGDGESEDGRTDAAESPQEGYDAPAVGFGFEPADGPAGDFEAFDEMDGMAGMGWMAMEPAVSPWDTLLDNTTSSGALVERLVDMADHLQDRTPAIGLRKLTAPIPPIVTLGQVIVAAADEHRELGELDEAWRVLQAGLTLTSYLAREVIFPEQLQSCWDARAVIQQGVQAWAGDPQQTVERLQNAHAYLTELRGSGVVSAVPMWENQYSLWRQAIEQPESEPGKLLGSSVWPGRSRFWPPESEKERLIRLMGVVSTSQMQLNDKPLVRDDDGMGVASITPEDIRRWEATTPTMPYGAHTNDVLNITPMAAAEVATPLIIRLQLYRLEHGAFPDSLDQLRDEANPEIPRDPATGGMFGYAPQGFDVPVLAAIVYGSRGDLFVPPGMPLLWSPGTVQPVRVLDGQLVSMTPLPHVDASQLAAMKQQADEMFFGNDETVLERQVMFISVGHTPW